MIKQMMKISAVAACCLLMCQGTFAEAVFEDVTEAVSETASENGVLTAIAGESGTTYENFFDVTLAEENYDLWYDCTAAIVGESAAADTVAFMQGYISSDLYGEEARAYYEANPDAMTVFDCFYINGLKLVTFNPDNTITVELEDGSKETHSYEYLGVYTIGEGETMVYMGQEISIAFPCDVYKSKDDAGEFNYFFLWDDDKVVGLFKVRHYLNEVLREGSGHIGFGIIREYRERHYGTEGLKLALEKAGDIVREDTVYMSCFRYNTASLKTMLANGAWIDHEDDEIYYTRVKIR